MSDTLSPTLAASRTNGAQRKVFRSELNPVDFLVRAAYMYPEKIAVVHGERRGSYGLLAERSWQLANGLGSAGLNKGDRGATLLLKSPPMLEAHVGVPGAGGSLDAVKTRLARREVGELLTPSG